MPMKVKICGLRRVEDALMLNEFESIGYAGIVFANTKRKVTVEDAVEIRKVLRSDIKAVGIFTETSAEDIAEIVCPLYYKSSITSRY